MTDERGGVVVVGSVNCDLVLDVQRIPAPGETVLAGGSRRVPGGKGANQAVASARAGAVTTFVGAVGADVEADLLTDALRESGVRVELVRGVPGASGLAVVVVDSAGQNSIVVAPGANASLNELTADEVTAIERAQVLLCQLEIPLCGVLGAARAAHAAGGTVVLNAAPSQPLPDELWDVLDVLIVNEHEAADLTGGRHTAMDEVIDALLGRVPQVVVTLGADGARYAARDGSDERVAAPAVTAVDTTGAGDTFCGVFAASLARNLPTAAALRRATAAASLSVQRAGAVPSIPTAAEIDAALAGLPQ